MDYEQKYKAALERAKQIHQFSSDIAEIKRMEQIFPELKESEDERIRKAIIATIHLYYGEPLEDEAKEMIAWLEKQGEQKPKWTKEDGSKVKEIIYFLDTAKVHYASTKALEACIEWLKSLNTKNS